MVIRGHMIGHAAQRVGQIIVTYIYHDVKIVTTNGRLNGSLAFPTASRTGSGFTPQLMIRYVSLIACKRDSRFVLTLAFLSPLDQPGIYFLPRSSQLFSGIRPNGPTGIVSICFSSYSIPVPPCFFYSLFDIFIRCSSGSPRFFHGIYPVPHFCSLHTFHLYTITRPVNRISGRLRQVFLFSPAIPARFIILCA